MLQLGWPRRTRSPSKDGRFRADGSSFVIWFRFDESNQTYTLKFHSNPTNYWFLIYIFMWYNVLFIFVIYFTSLDIINKKNWFIFLIYFCYFFWFIIQFWIENNCDCERCKFFNFVFYFVFCFSNDFFSFSIHSLIRLVQLIKLLNSIKLIDYYQVIKMFSSFCIIMNHFFV